MAARRKYARVRAHFRRPLQLPEIEPRALGSSGAASAASPTGEGAPKRRKDQSWNYAAARASPRNLYCVLTRAAALELGGGLDGEREERAWLRHCYLATNCVRLFSE